MAKIVAFEYQATRQLNGESVPCKQIPCFLSLLTRDLVFTSKKERKREMETTPLTQQRGLPGRESQDRDTPSVKANDIVIDHKNTMMKIVDAIFNPKI